MMNAARCLIATGLLLSSGSALAGPGLPPGHDDVVYPGDAAPAPEPAPRRVDVVITERGPEPRDVAVERGQELELVLTRASAMACRSDVVVSGYDLRTTVPAGRPVSLRLLASQRGQVHLSCPVEDVVGVAGMR